LFACHIPGICRAALITYTIDDYRTQQSGYSIHGEIVVDRKPNGAFELKDWSFDIENPSTIGSATEGMSTDPGATARVFGNVYVTADGIFLPVSGSSVVSGIELSDPVTDAFYRLDQAGPGDGHTIGGYQRGIPFWDNPFRSPGDVEFAHAVPEPASVLGALCGIGIILEVVRRRGREL
jgi:hypothetical protein